MTRELLLKGALREKSRKCTEVQLDADREHSREARGKPGDSRQPQGGPPGAAVQGAGRVQGCTEAKPRTSGNGRRKEEEVRGSLLREGPHRSLSSLKEELKEDL